MKQEKKWCVYKHTCPNGKIYIGISSNIKQRWSNAGEQYHQCKNFYYAIRKYGWINIQHEILHNNLTKEEAERLEIEYIAKYKTNNILYGYNMTTGGSGCPNNSGYRRVNQYTLDGKLIKTYNTIRDASRELNVSDGCISSVCRKKQGHITIKGYIFRYEGDDLDLHLLIKPNCISILQLDENKNIINEFPSIKIAAHNVNADSSSISHAINNHHKCNGYYWCKKDKYDTYVLNSTNNENKKVIVLDSNNIINTFDSINEAARELNINQNGIRSCLKKRYKKSGGYTWKYDESQTKVIGIKL